MYTGGALVVLKLKTLIKFQNMINLLILDVIVILIIDVTTGNCACICYGFVHSQLCKTWIIFSHKYTHHTYLHHICSMFVRVHICEFEKNQKENPQFCGQYNIVSVTE